jgi:murein DD-endopeptidase MepM/ murein hydrolase activator NlpD
MNKTTSIRRSLYGSTTLALITLLSGCGNAPFPEQEEEISSVQSALDNICTSDPTRSFPEEMKRPSQYTNDPDSPGFDLFRLNVVGPHCQSAPGTPGFDARCCVSGTKDYVACKTEQEQAADAFLSTLHAKTPLLSPFRATNVAPSWGYYNEQGVPHGAIDFGKSSLAPGEDPGFDLHAPADGVVVWKGGGDSAGNMIVLRHEAPNGQWYLTEYRHVRGGRALDKKAACSCLDTSATTSDARLLPCSPAEKKTAICLYAANPAYDSLWGTDADVLPPEGALVEQGKKFARAGNTGTVTLHEDGTPKTATGNTHVHFMLWMPRPDGEEDGTDGVDVMFVDPLGVYSKVGGSIGGKGCYALDAPSTYDRMLAPHLPELVNTPYAIAAGNGHASYYPNAGWGPQTFNLYNAGGQIKVTGAYHPSVQSTGWKIWMNLNKLAMEDKVNVYTTRKVREMSVRLEGGAPRYTAIWEAEAAGEQSEVYLDRSLSELDQLLNQKVTNGPFGVLDHFVHVVNGVERHNISFATSIGDDFFFYKGKTNAQALSLQSMLEPYNYKPFAVSATEGKSGSNVRFSVLFRPMSGDSDFKLDMDAKAFEEEIASRKEDGWRLVRSQGYDNGTKFLGLWQKP